MAAGDFGSGLGTIIGAEEAKGDLSSGINAVNSTASGFGQTVSPYNNFGQSFLPQATITSNDLLDKSKNVQGYQDFLKNYQTSPAATYTMQQADEAQNNSAASKEGLLSGANLRSLSGINQGVAAQGANTAYSQYLAGNNQQFGQLEQSLGNMFSAIGIGQTATGQQAGVTSSQIAQQSALAQAQAKNDQSKGSGFGSLFSGLGSIATAF